MSANLDALLSDEFPLSLGVSTTAAGLRRALQRSSFVKELRESLTRGEVTEAGIRRFLARLMREFRPGVQFFHEPALAAIAVVLEHRSTAFAEEYLLDLARLKHIAEMDLAPRVAAISLKRWLTASKKVVTKRYGSNRLSEFWRVTIKKPLSDLRKNAAWSKVTIDLSGHAKT